MNTCIRFVQTFPFLCVFSGFQVEFTIIMHFRSSVFYFTSTSRSWAVIWIGIDPDRRNKDHYVSMHQSMNIRNKFNFYFWISYSFLKPEIPICNISMCNKYRWNFWTPTPFFSSTASCELRKYVVISQSITLNKSIRFFFIQKFTIVSVFQRISVGSQQLSVYFSFAIHSNIPYIIW